MKKLQFPRWPKQDDEITTTRHRSPTALFLIGLLFLTVLTVKENAQTGSQALEKDQTAKLRKDLVEAIDPFKRAEAARLLAQGGDKRSVKLLMKSTEDPDAKVRVQAILALGQLRARSAVNVLIQILQARDDLREKSASAFSLGIIRDRRAVEPLIGELKIAGPQLQQNIVVALGLLGDPRAVEPLLALHHDENHETCAPIAIALGQIKSEVPATKLFEWLNSDDAE
ncbi:MAG: HEAT repeat domain-containing protein, partial [Pyrinomonadaceae bacterium]